jgi:hypothetical protein
VGHVASESIDADLLPKSEDSIHLEPGIRHWLVRRMRVWILASTGREIVAIVQLDRFIPIVEARRPGDGVVAGHLGVIELAGIQAIAATHYLAGWTNDLAVDKRRQT